MKNTAKILSLFCLTEKFPDEASVVKFFEDHRWGGELPCCPRCDGQDTIPRPERHGHFCRPCRRAFTVRTGTIFEESRLPLRKWLFAMYILQTARKGVSSLQLSKELKVTQKTAWFMLHRLREACGDKVMLSGDVEIDETYIGGLEKNKHEFQKRRAGRGGVGKAAVVGLRERGVGGRTLAMHVPDTTKKTLHAAVRDNVARGSVLFTDENPVYKSLDGEDYMHHAVNHSANEYVRLMAHTNGIESVWAVMKRGIRGVYHQVSHKHLDKYVGEFTFRLNEGNVRIDTIDRLASLVSASAGKRMTYERLIAKPAA